MPDYINFDEWLEYGISMGWCSDRYCSTHDITSMVAVEDDCFEDGGDPCIPAVRVW